MLKLDRQFGLYVIREPLAMSSSKACCRAEDPFFDRDVILKLVGPDEVGSRENLDRLSPYLDSLAGLEHPAIAPVYDSGIEGDACYFTTVYYPDGCLADQLKQPMNIGKGLRIILQLSSALAYAYSEGFEQGKLSLKDIFFSSDGHAVIADFGVAATITRLKQKNPLSAHDDPDGARIETLKCLGDILVKLLLGPGAKSDAVSTTLLGQSHGKPIIDLTTDLLGLGSHEIKSFEDLLVRLRSLALLSTDDGINDYVEYVEQTNSSSLTNTKSGTNPVITPSQRQLEIKEAVYAKGEIRRLVAEKNKLQVILQRAVNYKKHAEQKIEASTNALKEAKKAEKKALVDAKLALEQLSGHRPPHWHPALWLAGGVLAGSLITGSYNYFRASDQQPQLQAQNPAQQAVPSTPVPPQTPVLQPTQDQVVAIQPEIMPGAVTPEVQEPVQETTKLWWPAGDEFDATAAVPLEMTVKVERLVLTNASPKKGIHDTQQAFPLSASTDIPNKAPRQNFKTLNNTEPWWPAGNEFDPPAEYSAGSCPDVVCVVKNWAKAWSNKDLEGYFSFYSEDYRPEPGRSLDEWHRMRLERLSRPQWIKVMIEDLQIRPIGVDRVQIKLKQIYSSDYYQDQILKSLNLVKENGQWRILTERSLGALNPANSSDMVGG
ncbi:L,D-transpeptidase Cds6 family protein [Geopsychrobacter electrodiphilus]|uniref:L,D-transpeptidase Cds6 family protein n=1 Tax=Geopsychrobacter electrodiphilus TaxID=225196 RepID=UPI0012EBD5C6|nr:protein kinase [Geopsychrobacter electrodiphilus]